MPVIKLTTVIRVPRERVFDLARSIDAHQDTTGGTEERAVAGITHGLIGKADEVTWEARRFGIRQRLTVRITAFDCPKHFQDVMISGASKSMTHDHEFAQTEVSSSPPAAAGARSLSPGPTAAPWRRRHSPGH